ncbi:MAG: type III-A CRISPR-associated RAMP protein Csm5 [Tenuifilum sp.]|uniref:type III-A CRISPR-associated RAMP protein Csm5 n=1 Tax=Tenuifilum sp. TaxID=2760880 RepID=UPI002BFF51EF|nr:type III-A CRISPR-associated RAMP protein Csm5 [Paludibacteraceae bacterium]HPD25079.1 type III-A CRISPR-associated RAMP protein Csm5 [Bacteroidales bacterium]
MAEFIAKTLTAVHVGSGNKLVKNFDFFTFKDEEDYDCLAIIDVNKVVNVIGINNIEKLINFIDKKGQKNIYSFINESANKKFIIDDISKRQVRVFGDFVNKTELKEQYLNSDNYPVIPGSSLKGAIRTAIARELVLKNKDYYKRNIISKINQIKNTLSNQEGKIKTKHFQNIQSQIINTVFSGSYRADANKNTMRFLTICDIVFTYETQATVLDIINYTANGWNPKQGQSAIIETISEGCESEPFRITINNNLLKLNKNFNGNSYLEAESSFLNDIKNIFKIVNDHTKYLVENEIGLLQNILETEKVDRSLEKYFDRLSDVLDQINNTKEDEMVIRVGGNTGWFSITGGWAKEILDEENWQVLYHLLNKNRSVKYFPKTRKTDEYGEVFGFLKIVPKK